MLCVGLDPEPLRFPQSVGHTRDAIKPFLSAIVASTADLVCAYKLQIAHFSALGAEALACQVIGDIRQQAPHALIILDAKRGDIGTTARMYAQEAFERYQADAVTVNPYPGFATLQPFLDYADRGTIILCSTSNPDAGVLQDHPVEDPLYERVARWATEQWCVSENVMLVAAATYPEKLRCLRRIAPQVPLLVPGMGAQRGDVQATLVASGGHRLIVSSSRAILYASCGEGYAEAARQEALRSRDLLRSAATRVPV